VVAGRGRERLGQTASEMQRWLDFAHDNDVAVVLNHHERKSEGEHGRQVAGATTSRPSPT